MNCIIIIVNIYVNIYVISSVLEWLHSISGTKLTIPTATISLSHSEPASSLYTSTNQILSPTHTGYFLVSRCNMQHTLYTCMLVAQAHAHKHRHVHSTWTSHAYLFLSFSYLQQ